MRILYKSKEAIYPNQAYIHLLNKFLFSICFDIAETELMGLVVRRDRDCFIEVSISIALKSGNAAFDSIAWFRIVDPCSMVVFFTNGQSFIK